MNNFFFFTPGNKEQTASLHIEFIFGNEIRLEILLFFRLIFKYIDRSSWKTTYKFDLKNP